MKAVMDHLRKESLQAKVMAVLLDKKWHCRGHEYRNVPSGQLAGGGGIQGLQNGTRRRLGFAIDKKRDQCAICRKKTVWDRWTGKLQIANTAAGIPKKLLHKIYAYYSYCDAIEQRTRPMHELIADHRFPMLRWGQAEKTLSPTMTEQEIASKFQILKKDSGGNHNLLKSRACEVCVKTGKRGTPLGIYFFYSGGLKWQKDIPKRGAKAERGCVGCGWYDFAKWRAALNLKLAAPIIPKK